MTTTIQDQQAGVATEQVCLVEDQQAGDVGGLDLGQHLQRDGDLRRKIGVAGIDDVQEQ